MSDTPNTMIRDLTEGSVWRALLGFAALFGFALGLGCQGFWYGDALAGCVPIMIGGVYLLSGHWRTIRERRELL